MVTDWPAAVPEGGTGFQLDHFFICSIWPMVINTAEGVRRIPQDYLNVARVLQLSEWTVMRKNPLSGSAARGINRRAAVDRHCPAGDRRRRDADRRVGYRVFGSGMNGTTSMWKNIIIAIVIIGVVGLLLEQGLILLARRFSWQGKK